MRLKYTIKSWSLSGGERQGGLWDATKSVFGAELTCHRCVDWGAKNLADFSFGSSISLPLSLAFISASRALPHSVSLSIQREIKQLTMMIKVTGPIKLHMKWLSTLSQHLWQRKAHFQLNGRTHNKNNISSSCSCATIINGNKFIFGYLGWWLCVICSQYLGSGWILIQLFKTEGRPQVAPLDSWVLAEIWPLIYVKGFFYTALFSLREHLQTRGHRRVFKQKGFNVAAAPPETTVSSPSATFKWHKKLNSCPPGAQMFFGVVSRETNKAPAEMAAAYRHSGWVHTV